MQEYRSQQRSSPSYLPSSQKAVSLLAGAIISLVLFVAVGYGKWVNEQIEQIKTEQALKAEALARIEAKLDILIEYVGADVVPKH